CTIACATGAKRTAGSSSGSRRNAARHGARRSLPGLTAFFAVSRRDSASLLRVSPRLQTARRPRRRNTGKPVPPALLAAALRAQSEGVFIAPNGNNPKGLPILFANESFCAMTGRSAAELVGRPHGLLHVDPAEVVRLRRWLSHAEPKQPLIGDGLLLRG